MSKILEEIGQKKIKPGYQTFSKIEGLAMGYPQQNIFLAVYG